MNHADHRLDFLPWEYLYAPSPENVERQRLRRAEMPDAGAHLADDVFIAESAAVYCDYLAMGERSYIAGHAYVTGSVELGSDSTINPYCVVRGDVVIGDGVRIGAHTSLLAFNHGTSIERPMFEQGQTSKGVRVADDVWIGSHVVILDGVSVGAHAIVGAGSVVTKDVAEWSVVAGNPARAIRDRKATPRPSAQRDLGSAFGAIGARARNQVEEILARCLDREGFFDRPSVAGSVTGRALRATGDAIEIAMLLTGVPPLGRNARELANVLQAGQSQRSGLIGGDSDDALWDPSPNYAILSAGYALRLLGSEFSHGISSAARLTPAELRRRLDSFNWRSGVWSAGSLIDGVATAFALDRAACREQEGPIFELFGWLAMHANRETGMWGNPPSGVPLTDAINGFYRLTRGTYAQFGLPLPYPEATVRTVMRHAVDHAALSGEGYNACNILDIAHPLWLVREQTGSLPASASVWAEQQAWRIMGRWVDGEGFAFGPDGDVGMREPGLQGTEMWLATLWYLSDILGLSDELGFRPAGVHRPEALLDLSIARADSAGGRA